MSPMALAASGLALAFLGSIVASGLAWLVNRLRHGPMTDDLSPTGLLPDPLALRGHAAVFVLHARTSGIKGCLATHSWLVIKRSGDDRYARHEKVSWDGPIITDSYPADALWFSNRPSIVHAWAGPDLDPVIDAIEAAIAAYPYRERCHYRGWPGPNSNTFIASILRDIAELDAALPPHAVGRDFLPCGRLMHVSHDRCDVEFSLFGLAGAACGARHGIELRFLGLAIGFNPWSGTVTLPGAGTVPLGFTLPQRSRQWKNRRPRPVSAR